MSDMDSTLRVQVTTVIIGKAQRNDTAKGSKLQQIVREKARTSSGWCLHT